MPEDILYITHDAPVRRSEQNYIAMVDLEPFGFAASMEQIWLTSLSESTFQVSCVPFRAYGIALNDGVELDPLGRQVTRVVQKSGHRVFRAFFPPALSSDGLSAILDPLVAACHAGGLQFEWSGDRHIAIDLPPGGRIDGVWQIVEQLASNGQAVWEWGDVETFRVSLNS